MVPAEREITIHDLFTHRSGLAAGDGGARPENLAQMVRKLVQRPLPFQPGSAWEYGLSTDVLGYLVEVVSGQTLDEFLRTRIFVPLGMNDTSFRLPREKLPRLSPLYSNAGGKGLERVASPAPDVLDPKVLSAGGGLVSTPADYVRFCQMLLNGGELEGHRLLGRKTIDLMTERHWSPIPIEFLKGQYFGLGVAVRGEQRDIGFAGICGSLRLEPAYNTSFALIRRSN